MEDSGDATRVTPHTQKANFHAKMDLASVVRRVVALSFARRADQKAAKSFSHIAVFHFTAVVATLATLAGSGRNLERQTAFQETAFQEVRT